MRDFIKAIGLLVVGLLVAIIGYPILHELGHAVIALIVGARVIEINILPLPNVLCNVENVDCASMVAIGLSGMIVPLLISTIIKSKLFLAWYANYIVKVISLLAFIISAISSVCFMVGKPLPNDDITQILIVWSGGESMCLLLSIALAAITIRMLILEKPIERCLVYFEGSQKIASAV